MWFLVWTRLKATARGWSLHAAVALVLWASLAVVGTLYLVEDVILFRPLPVSGRDRLFRVEFESSGALVPVSAADVRAVATQPPEGIDGVAGVRTGSCPIEVDGARATRTCATVTPGFFPLFGMSFGLDDRRSAGDVVVSDSFRRKALADRSNAVGRTIVGTQFDFASLQPRDRDLRVAAVAPRGFRVPGATEVWRLPPRSESRMGYLELWIRTPGPAAPPESALVALSARLPGAGGQRLRARSLAQAMTPKEAWPLLVLLAVSAGIALAGWVHAATLLAVRAYGRSAAVATKLALGASPRHLLLEPATDGFVVAAVSWLLSQPATALIVGHLSAALPFMEHKQVEYRAAAAAVTGLAALVGWLAFVALALVVLARRLSEIRGREGRPLRSWRVSAALLGASYCLTAGVLYVAATVALSYGRTVNRDFGFDTARLAGFSVAPTLTGDWQKAVRTAERLLRSSPSVKSVASVDGLPFFYAASQTVSNRGRDGTLRAAPAVVRRAGPGLLRTMGVRLLAGRDLEDGDQQLPAAAVLSRTLAATLFPDGGVLGRTISTGDQEHRVVGVCADIVDDPRNTGDRGIQLYVASSDTTDFLARTASDSDAVSKLAEEIRERSPGVLVTTISYDEQRSTLAKGERAAAQLVAFVLFASIAVTALGFNAGLLAALRENLRALAVRLALGAPPGAVILPAARPHVLAAVAGSVIGMAAAVNLMPLVQSMVPRVERIEPYAVGLCGLVTLLSMFATVPHALKVVLRSDIVTILNRED